MSATDLEFLKLIYNTSPLLAILIVAFIIWYALVKVGIIGPISVSDDNVGQSIEDLHSRVASLESKDLHGRVSKIEGYIEGKK